MNPESMRKPRPVACPLFRLCSRTAKSIAIFAQNSLLEGTIYLLHSEPAKSMPKPIDAIDTAILSALQTNARLTVAQLAERVHLSTSPAWRRVKRLENDGLITGYHAAISRRGLGWGVLAFVSVAI